MRVTFVAIGSEFLSIGQLSSILKKELHHVDLAFSYSIFNADIETRPFFKPFHHMPLYQTHGFSPCPNSQHLSQTGLVLPLHNSLSDEDLDRLVNLVAYARA
ncbi:MAG: DegT/DnrJ/EryC1/StrS family aminotransferase [Bdellovibrionota bacterium]